MSVSNKENNNRINKIRKKIKNPKKEQEYLIRVNWSEDKKEPEPGEILIIWDADDKIRKVVGKQKKNELDQNKTD